MKFVFYTLRFIFLTRSLFEKLKHFKKLFFFFFFFDVIFFNLLFDYFLFGFHEMFFSFLYL